MFCFKVIIIKKILYHFLEYIKETLLKIIYNFKMSYNGYVSNFLSRVNGFNAPKELIHIVNLRMGAKFTINSARKIYQNGMTLIILEAPERGDYVCIKNACIILPSSFDDMGEDLLEELGSGCYQLEKTSPAGTGQFRFIEEEW